jgi:polyribonucleotide 5'-hydroxyl-kinase
MQRNPMLLQRLIRNLGESISDRWDFDAEGRSSGLIVDTPASFAGTIAGQKDPDARNALLRACVDAFRSEKFMLPNASVWNIHRLLVNVILVVGHERLSVEMQRTFGERCTVVKVPKSGGVCHISSCPRPFCTQAYRISRSSSWTTLKGNVYKRENYTATCMESQSLHRLV